MAWFKHSSRFAILALALTLAPALNVSAQSSRPRISSLGSQLQRAFRPPARGLPDNRQGGATRSPENCFMDDRKLTALAPIDGGETAAENPTIFWYMPKMSAAKAEAPELEFTLIYDKDETDKDETIFNAQYPLTKSADGLVAAPGIMSLTLGRPALQVGQQYKWQIRVKCNAKSSDRSEDQMAEGEIKRVTEDPDLAIRAQQATPEERVLLYANANRWYEMLANLVALRRSRPNDPSVTDAWNQLFAVVKLDDVSIQSKSPSSGSTNNSN